MPELPEVETTLRGICSYIDQHKINKVIVRQPKLRWPIPKNLSKKISGQTIHHCYRRAKYIVLECDTGSLLLHLGMSGSLRVLDPEVPAKKHDHVDIYIDNKILRFTDPRRFGALLWTSDPVEEHELIKHLGPEPLDKAFNAEYLHKKSKQRKVAVKSFIMDGKVVVGVGNIYATEALYIAGIHPEKPAGKVSLAKYKELVTAIKKVLRQAIKTGGTTLRDFTKSDGTPGYFYLQLKAYGKAGHECPRCHDTFDVVKVGQRSSVFCPGCQRLSSLQGAAGDEAIS